MRPAGIYKRHDLMTYISWSANFRLWPIFHGWLGRAMVLGSFQCQDVLLRWHMLGQGPVVRVGCFLFYFFHLAYPIFLF